MAATLDRPASRLERLAAERARERWRIAIACAQDAAEALSALGVTVRITGSLASDRFGSDSDVDFLVVDCPRHLKYAIEGHVEDRLGDIPFDVIYLDEIPPGKADRFTKEAVDAGRLR